MAASNANDPGQMFEQCLQQGNLALADVLARETLRLAPGYPGVYTMLARVARVAGEPEWAEAFAARDAQQAGSTEPVAPAPWSPADTPDPADRFLLIRSWGYGFWSDVDHVLSQIFLAEITGRTPVVHWAANSLFHSPGDSNAWESFFQPVSDVQPDELASRGLPVFPDKWAGRDPLGADVNKLQGPGSRAAAVYFLHAEQPLAVADFHTGLVSVLDWVRPGHPAAGKTIEQLYRELVRRHLRLQPTVAAHIDALASSVLPEGPRIAVHMRGSDKLLEDAKIGETIDRAPARIDAMLERLPGAAIFLLTDDEHLLARFRERYGDRVRTTDVARSSDRKGVHTRREHDPRRLGMEVLADTYLAARCDEFLGLGSSNLSCMVQYLKDWPEGACSLLGESLHHKRNWSIHMPR